MTTLATWKHRGTLYCEDNATAETSVDATPRKITALGTKGVESGLTVDTANNQITIDTAGDYLVTASISFSGSNSSTVEIEIYKNTVGTNLKLQRKLGTGGDVGNSGVTGIITCAADDDVSLYQASDGNSMTITNAQLNAVRLS